MLTCDPTYSVLWENLKYAVQASYLVPAAILYSRILYVMWAAYRNVYSRNPFFVIYSMDCLVGLILLMLGIIARMLLYVPQLCLSGSKFFLSHPYLMDIYYPFLHYLHCVQPLVQMFLTTNRMSCVLFPVHHDKYWQPKLPFVFLFIALTPIPFISSAITSTKNVVYFYGGFFMIGTSAVQTIIMVMFVFRLVAVVITILTTFIMFYRMSKMSNRLKNSERTLCMACAYNSACFMVPSFVEALATFYKPFGNSKLVWLIEPLSWDFLNVGSPIVMIFVSSQLRHHVFPLAQPQHHIAVSPSFTGAQMRQSVSFRDN